MQQRLESIMTEARGHINLDSWCRFDIISKNELVNLEERIKRYSVEVVEVSSRHRLHRRGGKV